MVPDDARTEAQDDNDNDDVGRDSEAEKPDSQASRRPPAGTSFARFTSPGNKKHFVEMSYCTAFGIQMLQLREVQTSGPRHETGVSASKFGEYVSQYGIVCTIARVCHYSIVEGLCVSKSSIA